MSGDRSLHDTTPFSKGQGQNPKSIFVFGKVAFFPKKKKKKIINLLLLQVAVVGDSRRVPKETTRVLASGSVVLVEGADRHTR